MLSFSSVATLNKYRFQALQALQDLCHIDSYIYISMCCHMNKSYNYIDAKSSSSMDLLGTKSDASALGFDLIRF